MPSTELATRAAGAASAPVGRRTSNLERIESNRAGIAAALPAGTLPPERFIRAMQTEMLRRPQLAECTPESLMGAVLECAQLGLEPGPLQLAVVLPVFDRRAGGMVAQLRVEYRGYVDLFYRSGQIKSISLGVVREGDDFKHYRDETGEHFYHEELVDEEAPVRYYYGVFVLASGGSVIQKLTPGQVDKRRMRGDSQRRDGKASSEPLGAWGTDYESMALKTVIRAAENKLPKSAEVARALVADEQTVRNTAAAVDAPALIEANVIEAPYEQDNNGSAAAGVNGSSDPQGGESAPTDSGASFPPESPPAPAPAISPKATSDELNRFTSEYQKSGRHPAEMSKFVSDAIGRNVRGLTTLTSDEVARALAAFGTPETQQPVPAAPVEDEVEPSEVGPPADDGSLALTDDELTILFSLLENNGIPLGESQRLYIAEALTGDAEGELPSPLTRGHVARISEYLKGETERQMQAPFI